MEVGRGQAGNCHLLPNPHSTILLCDSPSPAMTKQTRRGGSTVLLELFSLRLCGLRRRARQSELGEEGEPWTPLCYRSGKGKEGNYQKERRNEKGKHNKLSGVSQLGFSKIESASL